MGDVEEERDGGDVKPQQAQALVLEELESKSIRENSRQFMGAAAAAVANNGIIITSPLLMFYRKCASSL